MDGFENLVRLEVYRFFVDHGRAPVPAELAIAVDASTTEVEDALTALAAQHVLVLVPGASYIWMANPFSAMPTDFKVYAGGREWWANCIWDAFGILAVLGSGGTISTHCPDCSQPQTVEITAGGESRGEGVVHYAVPARGWWDDIGHT